MEQSYIYMNAAEFLSGVDNALAEQAIATGRRLFPSSALHWEVLLARHYAWALSGATDSLGSSTLHSKPVTPADNPYARHVRETLLASTDPELLDRAIEQLQNPAFADFSRSLCDRLIALQPNNPAGHIRRYYADLQAAGRAEQTAPDSLSDSNRLLLLEGRLLFSRSRRSKNRDARATARELLDLASRNPKDPTAGTAVYLANIAIGQSLLERGDVSGAVRSLLAAADAPPSNSLRYMMLDMTLARSLVDTGQRDAVAQFLDRCARFSAGRQPLKNWATELRKGHNPNLMPNFIKARLAGLTQ